VVPRRVSRYDCTETRGAAPHRELAAQRQIAGVRQHRRAPRLRTRCTLPITAPGVVTRIFTDLGVFEPLDDAYRLIESAPGYTLDDLQAVTEAPLVED
jgi:acyl CoA:acetate/3-ketoacid CoA transferase beta subunit